MDAGFFYAQNSAYLSVDSCQQTRVEYKEENDITEAGENPALCLSNRIIERCGQNATGNYSGKALAKANTDVFGQLSR